MSITVYAQKVIKNNFPNLSLVGERKNAVSNCKRGQVAVKDKGEMTTYWLIEGY